jgi:hypothetical protein
MREPLEFTHTTFKNKVYLYPQEVFAVTYMPTFQSVAIISKGGAAIPVQGTLDEVTKIITAAKQPLTKKAKEA